jgi:hypothetical protein
MFIFYVEAIQGVLSMEARVFNMTEELQNKGAKHEKSMAKVLESAASNYKALEEEHFKNLNTMKEGEERAQTEAAKRAQMEREMAEMREKVRKLESECIQAIRKAREEGKEEGKAEGKELGKEEAMGEVKAQFQMVYNSRFRHGWKSTMKKIEQPETSDLFLRTNTPLLYPEVGLKDSEDEADEEDKEEEETKEGQGEPDKP